MTSISTSLFRLKEYLRTGVQSTASTRPSITSLCADIESAMRDANASASRKGFVELATDAEAKTGSDTARAVTSGNLAAVLGGVKLISFDGKNGAGACTATGAAVGDKVIAVAGLTGGALGAADASFETTITVVDQIQQSAAGNLSANDYLALLLPVA